MPLIDHLLTFAANSEQPLIVIIGPTASGKTALSIEVAHAMESSMGKQKGSVKQVEIVNADSRQLYRFLDIGTGKICKDDQSGIPHHLLDMLDPKEEATAAWYKREAMRSINGIHKRGNVPVLVGGSMLYINSILKNLQFSSASDPKKRARLSQEYDIDDGRTLYRRLQEEDPETASKFHRHNKPYVIRALEILDSSGKPSTVKQTKPCPYQVSVIGIRWPREDLVRRINERTKQMFAQGWIPEVSSLMMHGYTEDDPGMKSQGYREIMHYVRTGKPSEGELMERIATEARQYAKRQMTWWRHEENIQWLDGPELIRTDILKI